MNEPLSIETAIGPSPYDTLTLSNDRYSVEVIRSTVGDFGLHVLGEVKTRRFQTAELALAAALKVLAGVPRCGFCGSTEPPTDADDPGNWPACPDCHGV